MVKLIALDLDRTTLTSDGHLSEANKRALSGAIKRGVHVCIASGRAFDTLPEEVLNVQGIEYAITSNGASVYRIADRKCIKSYILKPQSVDNVLSVCKQYPVTYEAFIRGCAYAAKEYIDNPVKYGATENAIQYVRSTRILKENIIQFINEHRNELDCMDIVLDDDILKRKIIDELYESDKDIYITSSVKQLIEISYKDAGKRSGVQYLAGLLGIDRKDIAAFGDADNTVQELPILMSNLQLSQKYEWEAYGDFEPEIGYTAAVGSGKISILRFSLTNSAFLQWSVRDKAAVEILSHFMGKDEDTESSDTSLWYVKKALYAFMKSQLPNTFFYGVFFIFYILLMVTIAYYYLCKIKKREYIWIIVPVLALVFTVGLFIRSRGMKSSGDSYFSALRVTDSEKEQENIYFLYQNDEGVEGNVNFLSTITSVIPMDYNYRTIVGKNIKTSGEDITINNTQKGFDVAFEESVPGTSRILKLSGNTKSASEKEVFTQDIFTTYTSFYGNITNTSSNNFSRVILIRGNQYAILKSVKAGEKASVSKDMVKCWNHFDEENSAFGTENENTVTGNIMEYLQQTYMNTQKSKEELLVVGITSENDFKLFSDDNVLKNHVTVMINHFTLEEETGDHILNINMSCLKQEGEGLAIEEDTLEENKTEVSYVFDKEEIEALARNKDNFTGKIYAYNYSTGQRDRILSSTESYITGESLNSYLSGDGEMRITYKMDASDEYGPAPVLSLIYKKQ